MRLLFFISLLLSCLNCTTTNKTARHTSILNATWIPVRQELGGKELPAEAFNKQQLIIRDTNYTVIAESVDKGIVKYNSNKIDIYGTEGVNAGKHIRAIYKIETDQLTVCYNLAGNIYPDAFATTGKPLYFLSVFKKEK